MLKRLTDWNTPAPREQTLAITGQKVGDEQVSVTTDIRVNPNAASLIVRLTYRRVVFGSNNPPVPEAVIVLVDLPRLATISKRITSDALLATSQWHFAGNSLILAKLFLSASPAHLPDHPSATSTYEAATLGFPDLNTNDSCRYNETMSCEGTNGCREEINKQANPDCANILKSTGVSNVSDFFGGNIRESGAKLAGRDCIISATSSGKTIALFECRTGHSYMDGEIYITKSRTSTVRTVPESKPILTIPLSHNFHEIPGVLATSNGEEYLLLLRDGIKLEGYRLPVSP